jgi:hypothetical protein
MQIPSLTQVEIGITKAAAVAAPVEAFAQRHTLPPWMDAALLLVSGAIIAVNHWFNRSNTVAVPASEENVS